MTTKILLLLIIKLSSSTNVESTEFGSVNMEHLKHTSIMFAFTMLSNNKNISTECQQQLNTVQEGILNKKPWAMKMLDSSGQKLPGFIFGQNYWLGYRDMCKTAQSPLQIALSLSKYSRTMHNELLKDTAPFDVSFTVIFIEHDSPWQVELKIWPPERTIGIGLCLPSTCQNKELKILMESYVASELFVERDIYELRPVVSYVKILKSASVIFEHEVTFILVVVLVFSAVMLTTASLMRERSEKEFNSTWIVKCFDLKNNISTLFDINSPLKGEIAVINGLRTFTALGVILMHVAYFGSQTYANKSLLINNIKPNVIILGQNVVDFFFTISGFLQAYKFFSNSVQIEAIRKSNFSNVVKEFCRRVLHRWLRLAPAYYATVCIDVVVNAYISNCSVYHILLRDDLLIRKHWWRYLTFTQVSLHLDELLAPWTWTTACEMQFFIVGTILLLMYARNPHLAKGFFFLLLGGSLSLHFFNAINTGYGFNFDSLMATASAMYLNPYVRCIPYFVGGFFGWYAVEKSSQVPSARKRFFFKINFGVLLFCLSPLINGIGTNSIVCSVISILERFCISIWTCRIIMANLNRTARFSSYLKLKIFRHFGKLSYAIYLVNPLVIALMTHANNVSLHLEVITYLTIFFCAVLISYFAAIGLSLIFEMPYSNLSGLMQKQKKE